MHAAISGGKRGRGVANAAARCACDLSDAGYRIRRLQQHGDGQARARSRGPAPRTDTDNDTPSESIRACRWRRSGTPMTYWVAAH
jgi:hypothetical protein